MSLFVIPPREDRAKILNNGVLSWVHVSNKEYRYDPDSYIFTQAFRSAIKISFVISLLVLSLVFTTESDENLFHDFRGYLGVFAPIPMFIPIYYFRIYSKNIDTDKYNLLIIRGTGEKIPNSFMSIFTLPLPIAVMLMPDYFAYHIYDTATLSKLEIFYDSYLFLFLTITVWVLINSAMILLCLFSLVRIIKIYEQYSIANTNK